MDIRKLGTEIPNLFEAEVDKAQDAQAAQGADGVGATANDSMEAAQQAQMMSGNIGQVAQALSGDGSVRLPNADQMPYFDQGSQNACGTTTLAEIMSYLGVPETKDDIDSTIRQMNIYTAPDDMIRYARDHGLEAEGYNNSSWDEVKAMLDAGHPVLAMVKGAT